MTPKESNKKFYIIAGAVYTLIVFVLCCHAGVYLKFHPKEGGLEIIGKALEHFSRNPLNLFPITGKALGYFLGIMAISAFVAAYLYFYYKARERSMPGKESGSSKWNTDYKEYNKEFTDPKGSPVNTGKNNAILSQQIFLNLDTRATQRNNNVLVIGGSGSGKSRFYIKPNIAQKNANYVITDPAGEMLASLGTMLVNDGYKLKIFNLVEMQKSHCYNPFSYVSPERDEEVLSMIDCLIKNTTSSNKKGGDQFWESAEKTLLRALCFYLVKHCAESDRSWATVAWLLRRASVDENDANHESDLDKLFNSVKEEDPDSIAVKQYDSFKQGAGKTLKSIIISCSVRLGVFDIEQIANLTSRDDMDLANLGMGKKALFVITPQADDTFNFLVAMLYTQIFQTLYNEGNKLIAENKSFDYEVRFLLDEFANIGQIPQFDKKISTMRKYRISCSVVIQAISQLKTIYPDEWETIIGNCDSWVFLGGADKTTLEYLSDILGTQTIRTGSSSHSSGKKDFSESFQYTSRKLMNPDELGRMRNKNCIVSVRGLAPFYSKKYDYVKHPNYKLTGDKDKKLLYVNTLDNMRKSESKDDEKKEKGIETDNIIKRAKFLMKRVSPKNNDSDFSSNILTIEEYLNKNKIDSLGNFFERCSVVDVSSSLSDDELGMLTMSTASSIMKELGSVQVKQVIEEFKESLEATENKNKPLKTGVGLMNKLVDDFPDEVDEFTKMFFTSKK